MPETETVTQRPGMSIEVSAIVPARNEEACLGACLESLVAQTGVDFEIIVVDDHSTDRTRELAASFAGVRVIAAGPLPKGWTGKNNAVVAGTREARGPWLLFTDADTVHLPGSLARALAEARENAADLLSYSPEQIAVSFWEMATLPVVFAELARQYPPAKVSDPAFPIAAANGQYILVRREAYDAVGGHTAIAGSILEDVVLARAVKASGRKIRFRYAADAVRTRMYRNFRQLCEGWTKNLALLFPNPGWLAVKTLLLWAVPWGLLAWSFLMNFGATLTAQATFLTWIHHAFLSQSRVVRWWWFTIGGSGLTYITARLRRANFDWAMEVLGASFGMPMFAYLLLRSKRAHAHGTVSWRGRTYGAEDSPMTQVGDHAPTTAGRLS